MSEMPTIHSSGMLTSAVTAKRKVVTYRKQASRMASFGAVRNDQEPLSNPYQTHDLCPVDLCPEICPNLLGSVVRTSWLTGRVHADCPMEGCAGIVRFRERQNHAFAP